MVAMECAQSTATGRPRIGEIKLRTIDKRKKIKLRKILRILKYWTDNYETEE